MKIGLVSTHAWPIPSPARTGDICVLDLAEAFEELGHTVTMFSPKGTKFHRVCEMQCAFGKFPPSAETCESECFQRHFDIIKQQDIVHDFSTAKLFNYWLGANKQPTCATILGGPWRTPYHPTNLYANSIAQMKRVQLGWTDYANTLTPEMGGPLGTPVPSCQFVYLGINTNNYIPSLAKDIYFLWLNRWHETKGYKLAIEIAKITKLPFIMAGEHPDNETNDHQRKCAIEAHELASHVPNITFMWLPSGDKHNEVKKMLYQQAKALIYTTQFQEPFGLSQVEALASGTPVIAPDYGSCPEIIRHGIDGFICDNDPKAFANACHQIGMIDTKDCRNRAVNTFDRKVSAQNWITEYTRIIK